MAKSLTAGASTAKDALFAAFDILVESQSLGFHYSFSTTTAGGFSWEHRLHLSSLSDIVHAVRPGGGLAAPSNVRVIVIDDGSGQSPSAFLATQELTGNDLEISFLFSGEAYVDRICLFNGVIEDYRRNGFVMEITAVSDEFPRNVVLPKRVIPEGAVDPASGAVGKALALVYGDGAVIRNAPMLLTNVSQREYTVADHPMRDMATARYGIYVEKTQTVKIRTGNATLDAAMATFTLTDDLTNLLFGGGRAGETAGTSLVVQREQDTVTAPPLPASNLIDNNTFSACGISTQNFADANGDGYGFAGVAGSWPDAEGLTTLVYEIQAQNGNQFAAATVNAAITVRVIDSLGTVLYDLDKFENLRWFSGPRDTVRELNGLSILPNQRIEVFIEARNEGGVGGFNEYWLVREVDLTLGIRPRGDQEEIYLVLLWEGRPDDLSGKHTGTASALITLPPDVLSSFLVDELGLSIETGYQATARARLSGWLFDGGIGGGWFREREDARSFIDRLARQCKSTVFSCDGPFRIFPYSADDPVRYAFDEDTILWASGTTIDSDPASRQGTLVLNPETPEPIYNVYELRYAFDAARREFSKVLYCSADGTNTTHPDGANLVQLCLNSQNRRGRSQSLIIEADFIYDENTAQELLDHLVRYYWEKRVVAAWESGTQGLHLELGDFVTIVHPDMPERLQILPFELHRIQHRFVPSSGPDGQETMEFRQAFLASRTNAVTFDYLQLFDQNGTPHFWYFAGANLTDDLTTPSVLSLIATPRLGTFGVEDFSFETFSFESGAGVQQLEWLQVDAVDNPATQLYMWPHPQQNILVDTSPPPIGMGFDIGAGIELRSTDGRRYVLAAHTSGVWVATPV